MESGEQTIKPFAEIAAACRLLVRPPFVTILLLDILLAVVSASVNDLITRRPANESELIMMGPLLLGVISIYLHIATTLAAGGSGEGSGDGWIRAAFRHRCFWRYVGAVLVSVLLTMLGLIAVVIGGIIVGSWVALSQTAVVLDRKGPIEAVNRSSELTKPVRKAVGIMFAVFWVPVLVSATVFIVLGIRLDLVPRVLVDIASTALALTATIAFTRVYVKLGGTPTPPLQTLLYKSKAGSPA